jgi:fatty-acyl-CoA synthase
LQLPLDEQQKVIVESVVRSGAADDLSKMERSLNECFAALEALTDGSAEQEQQRSEVQPESETAHITPYDIDLEKNPANFRPLTPLSFLERAALAFPGRTAIIHGSLRRSYAEFYARSRRLGSALARRGIARGDTVSVVLANTPAMLECHYGVPMTGAVLNTMNTRLDAPTIAYQLDHAEAKVLIVDREFSKPTKEALKLAKVKPLVIDYDDPEFTGTGERLSTIEYEGLLDEGDEHYTWKMPGDEWDAIALNYTSDATGSPRGVVYHHRGAYLLAVNNIATCSMAKHPVLLWTLPIFHCNGWSFPWSLSVAAGTHVCLRSVSATAVYKAIADHKVTHLCGAPIVMTTLINARPEDMRPLPHVVEFFSAGGTGSQAVRAKMNSAGFNVTQLYGLTETYGPSVVSEWHSGALEGLDVIDPETMAPVPRDGTTIGEVMFRGNTVMKGYLKNRRETQKAFEGGWFHSGDRAVMHPEGYLQLKDRSNDIIVSGGQSVSLIEVEDVLYRHPAVLAVAVVAKQDDQRGETPYAFVELKPGRKATTDDLIAWCSKNLAPYKCPRHIVIMQLPKTSTGGIQKAMLREMANNA